MSIVAPFPRSLVLAIGASLTAWSLAACATEDPSIPEDDEAGAPSEPGEGDGEVAYDGCTQYGGCRYCAISTYEGIGCYLVTWSTTCYGEYERGRYLDCSGTGTGY